MSRLTIAIFLACLLLWAPDAAQAQTGSADEASAAFLFAYYPKPGMRSELEDGYRAHLDWHRQHDDPLTWYAWYVVSGERLGLFIDGTFGLSFGDFDRRVEPAADRVDFVETTAPYVELAFRRIYRLRPELSTGRPLEERRPTAALQAVYYRLRPGTETRFASLIRRVSDALADDDSKPPYTWYELVAGGEHPTFLLLIGRERWLEYEDAAVGLTTLITSVYTEGEAVDALKDLSAAVREIRSETWVYRRDLSYFPDQETGE